MNRNIDFLISEKIKMSSSEEEIEIFNAYKSHLDRDFEIFKQANLALTLQEKELQEAKTNIKKKYDQFHNRKKNAKEVLRIIHREVEIERVTLNDLKRESNQCLPEEKS